MIEGKKIEITNNKWDRCARKSDLKIGIKTVHLPMIGMNLITRYDTQIFLDFITKKRENSSHLNMLVTRLIDIETTIKPIIDITKESRKSAPQYEHNLFLQEFLNAVPIIIDPCTEYTYYNSFRKILATNPNFPIEIRKLSERILMSEEDCRLGKIARKEMFAKKINTYERFWLNLLDDERLLTDLTTKVLNMEHGLFADIGLPPVPVIYSLEFLEVTKRINKFAKHIWKGENCAAYIILTSEILDNELLLYSVIKYIEELDNKFIVLKFKNLQLDKVSYVLQRSNYKKILEAINRIKKKFINEKIFILLEAGYQLYPSIAGGFDIVTTTLRGYDKDTSGWGKPENAGLGSWFDPKFLVFRGIKDVRKMLSTNGGVLKCSCLVCVSSSRITPRNEWNRQRREHYMFVLGQLLNDLSSYIDAKRMELATNKLAKSALSNFKNMLPLVSDD